MRLLLTDALLVLSLLFVRPAADAAWRLRLLLHGLLLAACLLTALVDGAGVWACLIGIASALLQPVLLRRFARPDADGDVALDALSRRGWLRLLGALLLVALAMRLLPATLPEPVAGSLAGTAVPAVTERVPDMAAAGDPAHARGRLPEMVPARAPGSAAWSLSGAAPAAGPATVPRTGAGAVSEMSTGAVPGALADSLAMPETAVAGLSRALLSVSLGILLTGLLGACCAGSATGRIGALLLAGNGLLLVACQLPGLDLLSLGSLLLLQGGLIGLMIRTTRSHGLAGNVAPEGT